jgi:hypothetical protein
MSQTPFPLPPYHPITLSASVRIERIAQPIADDVDGDDGAQRPAVLPLRTARRLASGNVAGLDGVTPALRVAELHAPVFEVVIAKRLFANLPDRALARAFARWQTVATLDGHDAVMNCTLGSPNSAEAIIRAIAAATGNGATSVIETIFAGVTGSIAAHIPRDTGAVALLVGGETDALPILASLIGCALLAGAAVLFRDACARTESRPALTVADAALARALKPTIRVATARRGTDALTALADLVFAACAARSATAVGATRLVRAMRRTRRGFFLVLLFFVLFLGPRSIDVAQGADGGAERQPGQNAGDAAA